MRDSKNPRAVSSTSFGTAVEDAPPQLARHVVPVLVWGT